MAVRLSEHLPKYMFSTAPLRFEPATHQFDPAETADPESSHHTQVAKLQLWVLGIHATNRKTRTFQIIILDF